jgi:glycosyltransferase involved in cell wall biosynthesis
MNSPRVSIVIPFYNAARFLRETVDSVRAQTFTDWELLLVDDGSTDESTQIAKALAAEQPRRIRYLEHERHANLGVNAARNLGTRAACGEIFAFLDSDDIWMSEKLETHVGELDTYSAAEMLFAPTLYWYEWYPAGNPGQSDWIPPLAPGGHVYAPPMLLAVSYPLGAFGAPCPCSFLVRRAAFERIGGFDECFHRGTFQLYEDIAFLAKIYLHVPVYVSAACLDRNRCSPYSMTRQRETVRKEEAARRFYFEWLRRYLREQGVRDAEIARAVRRESWFYALPLPVARFYRRLRGKMQRLCTRLVHLALNAR